MEETFSFRIKKSQLRRQAHFFFDNIWKHNIKERSECYLWLHEKLEISKNGCHFSRMNRTLLIKSIKICVEVLNDNIRLTDLPKYKYINN